MKLNFVTNYDMVSSNVLLQRDSFSLACQQWISIKLFLQPNRTLWSDKLETILSFQHYSIHRLSNYKEFTWLASSEKNTATTTTTKSTKQTTTKNINIIVTKLQYYHLIMHLQFVFDFCSTTLDNKLHTTISNNWLCTTVCKLFTIILPDTDLPITVLTINVSAWYTLN